MKLYIRRLSIRQPPYFYLSWWDFIVLRLRDGYDGDNKIINELITNNPKAIKKGMKQLVGYIDEANKVYGRFKSFLCVLGNGNILLKDT